MSKNKDVRLNNDWNNELRIGIVGLGEAGSALARGLKSNGAPILAIYDDHWDVGEQGKKICSLADTLGIPLVFSLRELARASNLIVSCVTPSAALSVAKEISVDLNHHHTFIDLNSTSPNKKEMIASLLEEAGAEMIDGAIMGSVMGMGFEVPIILSGYRSDIFSRLLQNYGMKVEAIQGPVGTAATIKMLRSLFMKGLEALVVETAEAARAYGKENEVMQNICRTLDERPFADVARYLLESHPVHATRRAKELEDVLVTLQEGNINSEMAVAVKEFMIRSAQSSKS